MDVADPDAYALGYNTLIGQVKDTYYLTCQTPCEQCFTPFGNGNMTSKICALFSLDESFVTVYPTSNFTFNDITNGNTSAGDISEFVGSHLISSYCLKYTNDQYDNSEVCLTYGNINSNFAMYCNITYNDVLCNFCTLSADDDCLIADCTNVDATYGTLIDRCQKIGVNGPFQFNIAVAEPENSTFVIGTCDIATSDGDCNTSNLFWSAIVVIMTSIVILVS